MLKGPPATGELQLLQLLLPQHPSSPTTDAATLSSPRPSGICTQAELLGHCCRYSPSILVHLWREHVSQILGMLHAAHRSVSFSFLSFFGLCHWKEWDVSLQQHFTLLLHSKLPTIVYIYCLHFIFSLLCLRNPCLRRQHLLKKMIKYFIVFYFKIIMTKWCLSPEVLKAHKPWIIWCSS